MTLTGAPGGTCTVTADQSGNQWIAPAPQLSDEVGITGDVTGPVITPSVVGTIGNNNWYVSDVAISWTVVEDESDITSMSGCDSVNVADDQAATTYTCEATSAGGTSSEQVSVKRDATAPQIQGISGLPTYPVFAVGQPVPALQPTATDNLSGVATGGSCSGFTTTTRGIKTGGCTVSDKAGNSSTQFSATYYVTDAFLGYNSPLPKSTAKKGSTIPVKLTLGVFAGGSTRVTVATLRVSAVPVGAALEPPGPATACAYSAVISAYQCQLKMPSTAGRYEIRTWQNLGTAATPVYKLVANASALAAATNANRELITIK